MLWSHHGLGTVATLPPRQGPLLHIRVEALDAAAAAGVRWLEQGSFHAFSVQPPNPNCYLGVGSEMKTPAKSSPSAAAVYSLLHHYCHLLALMLE